MSGIFAPIFAVVGPSGVGKDTLMEAVAARLPEVHLVRRIITRPEAAGGENFEGVSEAEFAHRLARGDFALHWQAHGLSYGIPAQVHARRAEGATVLFNSSRAALAEAARVFPGLTVIQVIARPEVLAGRLAGRGRESAVEIAKRLERATISLPSGLQIVEIDNSGPLDIAVTALEHVLQPASA